MKMKENEWLEKSKDKMHDNFFSSYSLALLFFLLVERGDVVAELYKSVGGKFVVVFSKRIQLCQHHIPCVLHGPIKCNPRDD